MSEDYDGNVYSIGYQGRSLKDFLDILREEEIIVLVDVRRNALSRKKGFSANGLRKAIEADGLIYIHMPGLGISSEARREVRNLEDHRKLLMEYRINLPSFMALVEELVEICDERPCVLMCFERDARLCHRRVLTDVMAERGFTVVEL